MHRERRWLRHGNMAGDPNSAPRCGARTRRGTACQAPAVRGRTRCRLHGGLSTGPRTPEGVARLRAARTRHGLYAGDFVAFRRFIAQLRREARRALERL